MAAMAGFLAVVVFGVVGTRLWRTHLSPPGKRFRRALTDHDEIAVLMHPNPDPDAMACAAGVARIAADAGVDAILRYPGEIRHPENRAFKTVLGFDADIIEKADELDDRPVVLVDHSEPRGFEGAGSIDPLAVIDHHPEDGTGTSFTDRRTEYGACSSIVAEYFEELGYAHGGDTALPPDVATGLLYGILADTSHLTRGCSPGEFDACSYLYPAANSGNLDRIGNPEMDVAVLETKARAITGRDRRGPFVVSDVGEVSNRDSIPVAADELLHLEGVSAVVVLGDHEGTIHLSGRSRDDRLHMGDVLDDAIADIPMAQGGGHARMGGGQVSIPHMKGLGPSNGISRSELHARLFESMAGE